MEDLRCPPRFATRRSLDRLTLGPAVARISAALGKPLLPHQQYIADVALEIDPKTGRLAYDDVTIVGPRQVMGKSEFVLPLMVHRCTGFGKALIDQLEAEFGFRPVEPGPQSVVYTAQTADKAREKWRDIHVKRIKESPLAALWAQPPRLRLNAETMFWQNGSTWAPGSTTGKALDVDTPIWSDRGWVTMGELKVGDRVAHPSGRFTAVLGVSPVMNDHPCFTVRTADGREVVADAEHLWTVTDRTSGSRPRVRTMTTEDLLAAGLVMDSGGSRFSLPRQAAVATPDVALPVDPYILGMWLGDGDRNSARFTVGSEDRAEMCRQVELCGYRITGQRQDPRSDAWAVNFNIYKPERVCPCGKAVRRNGLCDTCSHRAARAGTLPPGMGKDGIEVRLRSIGVLGAKHVPEAYMLAGTGQRLALLQGLMDTDGCITENHGSSPRCEFTSTNQGLAEAVLLLARSLGFKATVIEGRATIQGGDCGPKWRVGFTATTEDPMPFRMARKAAMVRPPMRLSGRRHTVTIKTITPVESRPVRCIKVAEPDGLFLAGRDLMVTHNTAGTGDSLDMPVIDEMWAKEDSRTELGLRPAMMTRPWRQFVRMSMVPGITRAVPEKWPYMRQKMTQGRSVVDLDIRKKVAYFEWSAPLDADPHDPATWWGCMPALGYTVPIDNVQTDHDQMGNGDIDFQAEYLGWIPDGGMPLWQTIGEQTWRDLGVELVPDAPPAYRDPIALGVDASPDLTVAAIGMAALREDGDLYVELIERRPGVNWVRDAVLSIVRAHTVCVVAIDRNGPLAGLIMPLARAAIEENLDLTIQEMTSAEVAAACATFFNQTGETDEANTTGEGDPDAVAADVRRARHINQPELTRSVGTALKHKQGDRWRWERDDTSPPLYAVSLAGFAGEVHEWIGGAYDIMDSLG